MKDTLLSLFENGAVGCFVLLMSLTLIASVLGVAYLCGKYPAFFVPTLGTALVAYAAYGAYLIKTEQ